MRRKKTKAWSNYGNHMQVFDVVYEVDKLDFIKLTEGKDSEAYKRQHKKAVSVVNQYNLEHNLKKFAISLGQCRAIKQMKPEFLGEKVTFFNAKNNGAKNDRKSK